MVNNAYNSGKLIAQHQRWSTNYFLHSQVVTEIGPVPPTAVQAIIREFALQGYVGKIELPSEWEQESKERANESNKQMGSVSSCQSDSICF